MSLNIASWIGRARAGPDRPDEVERLAQLEPRRADRHEQRLHLDVGHVQRVARVVDAGEHETDVGAGREPVVDLGVPAADDLHVDARDREGLPRPDRVHLDAVVGGQGRGDVGGGVQPHAAPDQGHQSVDVEVVGVLVRHQHVRDAGQVGVRGVGTRVQDHLAAGQVEPDAGVPVLRQSHGSEANKARAGHAVLRISS
jgi:hypothetical protein